MPAKKNKIKLTLEVDDKGTGKIKSFGKETDQAFDKMKAKTKATTSSMGASLKSLNLSFAAVTVAVTGAVYAISRLVTDVAKAGDDFHKMSLRVGVTTEKLSALGYAAGISGTNIETVEKSLRYLSKVMLDFSQGIGEARDTFEALDISVLTADGHLKDTADLLIELSDKFKNMTNATKMAAYASELFGARAGTQLLPLLKLGSEGIEELTEKARKLGIVFDTESAEKAAEFTDRMLDLTGAIDGVKRVIGMELLPVLTEYAKTITEITTENKKVIASFIEFSKGIISTGTTAGALNQMLMEWVHGIEEADYGKFGKNIEKALKKAVAKFKTSTKEVVAEYDKINHSLEESITLTAFDAEVKETYYKDEIKLIQAKNKAIAEAIKERQELEESFWDNYNEQTMTAQDHDILMLDKKYAKWKETYGHLKEFNDAYWSEYIMILDEYAEKTEEVTEETSDLWQHAMENMMDVSSDAMFDLFKSVEDGFENLLDSLSDSFLNFLSNLLSESLMTDIFSPLFSDFKTYGVQSLFGMGGASMAGPVGLGMTAGAIGISAATSEDPGSVLSDLADTVYDMTIFGFTESVVDAIKGSGHRTRLGGTYGISFSDRDFGVGLLDPYVAHADPELAESTDAAIIETIEATMQGYEDLFDELSGTYQNMVAGMLEDFEIESTVTGHSEHVQERIELALEAIPEQIGDVLDPIFQAAITAYVEDLSTIITAPTGAVSTILDNLIPESVVFDAIDLVEDMIAKGDQLSFEELYLIIDTIEDITDTLRAISDTWRGINFEIGVMLGEVSDLDQVIYGINRQFDAYADALSAYASPERMAQIESYRPEVIAYTIQEMTDAVWGDIMFGIGKMVDGFSDFELQIISTEQQFDAWTDALENINATEEQLTWLREQEALVIQHLTDQEAERIAKEKEWQAAQQQTLGIQERLNQQAAMAAAFDPMAGIMEDVAWRQSGMSRQAWVEQQLNDLGALYASGGFTAEEAGQAMGYITEWYSIAMREQESTANAWTDAADKAKSLSASVDATMRSIKYGSLNVAVPGAKYDLATPDYTSLYLAALGGDEAAIQEFLSFAPQYLALAQDTYKSSQEYQDIYTQVMKDMSAVKDLIESDSYTEQLYYESLGQGETLLSIDQHIVDMINTWNLGIGEVMMGESGGAPSGDSLGAEIAGRYGYSIEDALGSIFTDAHAQYLEGWLSAGPSQEELMHLAEYNQTSMEQILADAEAIVSYWHYIIAAAGHGQPTDWTGFASGGMSYGPESGYMAKLHGNELVVSPKGEYPATVAGAGRDQELAELKELKDLLRQLVSQTENPTEVYIDGKVLESRMYKVVDDAGSGRRMVQ